ncbi:MAG: hypothetical protein COA58_00595 [Bacteroidetes bacterium]|nr:MAG: hypothetical protein COA58_00595 [Bacteroidota bacterium]
MQTEKQLEIIEAMVQASRKSQQRNSFYYILWGIIMATVSIVEYYCASNNIIFWQIWPISGTLGGVISGIYGYREGKKSEVNTTTDLVSSYIWSSFMITLAFVITFTVVNHIHPHALVLALAGLATFASGGISRFKPLMLGGIALWIGAIICGFVVTDVNISIIYAISLVLGYVIPGLILRKKEINEA